MNPSPFSLDTQFFPEDAGEDKIDLDLGKWSVFGIDPHEENVHAFKSYMSSPPDGQEDMAWEKGTNPAMYGAFLRRPEMVGKDRNKLWIRKQAVIDPASQRRHEPPLCGGYCLFYEKKQRLPVTGDIIHRARLRLSLNLQRFIRHQAEQDDPIRPWSYRLQKRREKRTSFDDEQSLDGEDNWIPSTPEWQRFASRDHFGRYLEQIGDQLRSELTRACRFVAAINKDARNDDDWHDLGCEREDDYSLSLVETLWEFPSSSPIQDTWEIGAKLMNLLKEGGKVSTIEVPEMSVKEGSEEPAEAGRILNSPCFSIPIAEGVRVKLYAKTNKRIRFEIVQTDLWKHRKSSLRRRAFNQKQTNSHGMRFLTC